ncbi:MAG: dihydrodipicolinate synthase family protein [Thermomicrobiales bacterium]
MEQTSIGGRWHSRPAKPVRGVYAIPPTPFDAGGKLDEISLARCVDFCVAAGAHGVVAPVNASEAIILTDAERPRVTEVLVAQAAGRIPVVIGVSGVSTAASVLYAEHAAKSGADAVIAMPPYVKHPPAAEILDFYAAVARAADPLPVWIQDFIGPIGTPMEPVLLARLLTEIPGVDYLKEETAFAPQVMSKVRELAGNSLKGMMGGMAGRYLLEEYRRGAHGTMPACEVADAHVAVWNALDRGDEEEARRLHTQLLPLLNFEAMYSFTVYKEVLYRRGVIASPTTRIPGAGALDAENHRELDLILRDLEPLLTVGKPVSSAAS